MAPLADEFVAAGDFLAYKFPTWSWSSGDSSKTRDFLPKDKQYLVSKGVPCLRRVSQMEKAALGRKGGASAARPDERLLSFAEGKDGVDVTGSGGDDDWLATHLDDDAQGGASTEVGEIEDMPDGPPEAANSLSPGQEDDLASRVAGASLGQGSDGGDDSGEVGDIPDMDDEDDEGMAMAGGGVVEHEDPSTLAPPPPKAGAAASSGGSNILSVRTYDCLISYDKYYQTPRMWLVGYDEHGSPLKPAQIFEDISSDYAQKTVTIEPFPHSATLNTASIHPCKHASVMRKVIERMDASVKEEQKRLRNRQQQGGSVDAAEEATPAAGGSSKKKKWGLGGAMKKVASRSTSGSGADGADSPGDGSAALVEVEGLRVDQYLLVFLKFMASIVPAIEIDATQSF